ncbi:MAG: hypothetical protein ACT4PQ_07320 [Betaproteobacteria bacterium]
MTNLSPTMRALVALDRINKALHCELMAEITELPNCHATLAALK